MNKRTFLSESSASESEDDGLKHQLIRPYSMPTQISNMRSSASESEDDYGKRIHSSPLKMENPLKRKFESDDDLNLIIKRPKTEFKTPSFFPRTELSGSESEDRSSSERSIVSDQFNSFPPPTVSSSADVYNGYGAASIAMMKKMGFVEGTGLGKYGQGRTEIVEASKQRGRRGLGLHIAGLEPADIIWDSSKEKEEVKEDVTWIPKCTSEPILMSELREWIKEGNKKLTIDDETEFCDPDLLKNVLTFKSVFDDLDPKEMQNARMRSNPFETIRGGMFLNRAAMKMANMDWAFDFMFTNPKDEAGDSLIPPGELLYFADVCAGPGGFSEYVLYRKKWKCKGFGFTLKGANDFKLDDFFAGSPETFEPYYGVNGVDGDGNVYYPENLESFRDFVMESTDQKGVHFVMADGGFSVEGEENIQEILSKRLYLCQFLCALLILRTGGHFVCKLFDIFTVFSVGLVYLMYRTFEQVCIFKPNTSRPANSERYIVCKWRRENTKDICDYMFDVNCRLNILSTGSDNDVTEVVPLDVIKSDEIFFNYICESNNVIAERQILHLAKIKTFAQNSELHELRQNEFRRKCLQLWGIPDKARATPSKTEPSIIFEKLMKNERFKQVKPEVLNTKTLEKLKGIFEFRAVVCGELKGDNQQTLFISMGRKSIYYLDADRNKWLKLDITLELPMGTLLYAEAIHELKGEGKSQRKVLTLHVIDALFLGEDDVRELPYDERMAQVRLLAKAVSKPSRPEYTPLRVKQVWTLKDIKHILMRLCMRQIKGGGCIDRLCFNIDDTEDTRHFIPSGLLIFRIVIGDWLVAYSKTNQRPYYFNTKTNDSFFELEKTTNCISNFKNCYEKRTFWSWDKNTNLLTPPSEDDDKSLVHGHTFWSFVRYYYSKMTGQKPQF